jgi:hypothetical protein
MRQGQDAVTPPVAPVVPSEASVDGPPPPPPPPSAVDGPRVELRPVGDGVEDADHGHTVTVGRAVPAAEAPAAERDVSTRRVVLGTVAGVVCLLAVAVSLLVFGRGDDEEPAASSGPTTTQLLEFRPPQPQGVTVRAGEPGTVVVAWQAVGEPGDKMRYQVRPQSGTQTAQNTDQLTLTFDGIAEGERPCYTVVAITPDGRTSAESSLACL